MLEIIGDDQIFRLVLKPVEPVREFLVEQPAKAEVDRLDDHLDQVALGRQEWRRVARLKGEMGSQPLDLDPQSIGIFMEPVIGFIGRAIPVNDAAVTRDFELRIREKVLERAPEHHLVEADDPGDRPAGNARFSSKVLTPEVDGSERVDSNLFVDFGDFTLRLSKKVSRTSRSPYEDKRSVARDITRLVVGLVVDSVSCYDPTPRGRDSRAMAADRIRAARSGGRY